VGQVFGVSVSATLLLLAAMTAGLLVALGEPVAGSAAAALTGLAGISVGIDSVPEPLTRKETWLALAGTGLGAVLILSYVGGVAAWLRQPWQRIGIRVAGSWTAASALLVLALALAGPKASG
jgi:urease accessory protein